ncbi:hypothetical protein [Clostridium perfringens]|uniref:hypothetical protein n=1 Tax=Clostridium perfringens TaxID=1502 RepID=UPI000F523122|nr:hypothetical protein [Clostridium perfringens]UBK99500.1 hypothetical protein KLF26_09765 [Clostridium perfringens]
MAKLEEQIVRGVLDQFFDNTAIGNRGEANVDRLIINGTVIEFRVIITHKEVQKILGKKITIYSLTTDVEGKVDVLNPDPDAVSYSVKTPFGTLSVSIQDVITALAALL